MTQEVFLQIKENIQGKLNSLVRKYEQDRAFYLTAKFNETLLRSDFLDPFFELLGWDIKNVAGKRTGEREVLLEEPLKADAASHTKKPDYTFRLYGERKFFVEAKKPCVDITEEDSPARQVRRYGYTAGLRISVLSNFEDLYIYDTTCPVISGDHLTKAVLKHYHYTEYEENLTEILSLLGRESVYDGSFDAIWDSIGQNDARKDKIGIDGAFLAQINDWRLLLGKEILSAEPSIGITELGDIVQSYINKILFLRVCEDRNIETYQHLLQVVNHDSHAELIALFKNADRRYNSGLFKEQLSETVIGNISSSFWTIIRQLYYPESPYSFSVLSSDILGRIYELFLSKRLAMVDGELRIIDKPDNVDKDIVTTPHVIVKEILRQTMDDEISGMNDEQILNLKCADIACGSGAFLLELYQQLCDRLVDYYLQHDRSKLRHTNIDTYKLPFEIKRQLLVNCIFGVDKDFNAVEACKFGLLLKLLEDEDETTLSAFHPILPVLDENIFFGNSLLETSDVPEEESEMVNPFDFGSLRFDFIVGNPPYMKTEDIKNITPEEYKLYPKKYESAYKQYDKYFLFIQRAMQLLKEGGCMGYIVPSKFMKVGAGRNLRRLITGGKHLKAISSFGANLVFADKSTYTCLLVLRKEKQEYFVYTEVNNYKQWLVRNADAVDTCKRYESALGGDAWVLYTDKLKPLLEDKILAHSIPLAEMIGDDYIFNGIQTSANNVYIFTPIREDEKYYYFVDSNKREHQVEKCLTKPYFKTGKTTGNLSTYRSFEPNAKVIFPYRKSRNGKLKLIPLTKIEQCYPGLYEYLMQIKPVLTKTSRDIQPAPKTPDEWHRYGRHQCLEACEISEKIIVGVLAQAEKYAVDTHGTLVSSGGTAGYCLVSVPDSSSYSIYYIQAMLGSAQGEWLASLYGEIFRGGYIARGTKVLKQIPVRTINFADCKEKAAHDDIVARQKKLIRLGDKIVLAGSNKRKLTPLLRQMDRLKEEQQDAINALYGMSKQEESLIPRIKEIYAVD